MHCLPWRYIHRETNEQNQPPPMLHFEPDISPSTTKCVLQFRHTFIEHHWKDGQENNGVWRKPEDEPKQRHREVDWQGRRVVEMK